jgi:ferredoxin
VAVPTIHFANQTIQCAEGENLRKVLLAARLPLYNGAAKAIHCRGLGTCGTCAVQIEGRVSEPTSIERWRLSFPPHRSGAGLRLACQCQVLGDLKVIKHDGLWGQGLWGQGLIRSAGRQGVKCSQDSVKPREQNQ